MLGKVQSSQKGREATTSVKEQGTFWKLDKEFKEESGETGRIRSDILNTTEAGHIPSAKRSLEQFDKGV